MILRMAIIFERKTVNYNGEDHSVYRAVDMDVGGYGKNNQEQWLFSALSRYSTLFVINESNIKKFGHNFKNYNYFAGMIDENAFYEKYHVNDDYNYQLAKNDKLKEWNGFYTLNGDGTISRIYNENILEEVYKVFDIKKNETINNNESKDSLKKYGVFLTDKDYGYNPAIGRDNEIEDLELALITPDKSAILVGEAGVGKTAVVEGLVYKIQNNLVPDKLKDYEIVSINTSSLISGCQYVGMVEERVNKVISELRKNKKVIMFIDEIHTVIGAGAGSKSNLDVANILKPHLDRGDIKIIGSTTFEEYNNLMLDPAFKRRFKKVNIFEPEEDVLLEILKGTIDWLEKYYNIKFNFNDDEKNILFSHLLDVTSKECRDSLDKTNNPDLVLSIFKEAFAIASLYSHEEVLLDDIIKAIKNEDRLYESSRERVSLKLIKVFSSNISTDKKLTKVIKLSFNEN